MAKRRSAAHLARYQFQPRSAAPVVIRSTRVVKAKPKRRRSSGGGGMGVGTIIAAELAIQFAEPILLGFLAKSGMGMGVPTPILVAAAAHFGHADKYVKGVQLITKVKAVESVMGGGLGGLFAPPPAGHG